MSILLTQTFQHVGKAVRLDLKLGEENSWLVWSYSGVQKDKESKTQAQPHAVVGFRRQLDACNFADDVIHRRVLLTSLGQVRIGTVWRNDQCEAEANFDRETFSVNFNKGGWRLNSFSKACTQDGCRQPYPWNIYPLVYPKDENCFLEFNLPGGGRLVIPSLEFFTRCYGRSAELRRVITTYSWDDCVNKRLYAPLDEPEEIGSKWKVKLRKRLVNDDVVLLAHAKYDSYTQDAVKLIYAQLEAHYSSQIKKPAFIEITPWFQGPAEIVAKGIWFDKGRSFLALQVVGCSDPVGVPIFRGRENANNAIVPDDSGDTGTAWAGTPERVFIKPPEIVDLTDEVEPDPDAISAEIEDPGFEKPGERRLVINMRNERAKGSSGAKTKGKDVTAFSTGEPHGGGQGVGYAAIHAPPIMESHGILRDMWNALLHLKKNRPNLIQSVEWRNADGGYSESEEPKLIGFHPFDDGDEVKGKSRKWPYMDEEVLTDLRGVLVARVRTSIGYVHILEIQRRPKKIKIKTGEYRDGEDQFKGLSFVIEGQDKLEEWMAYLMSEIRFVQGVVGKLVKNCSGRAYAFMHSSSRVKEGHVLCESTVLNALSNVGVDVSV